MSLWADYQKERMGWECIEEPWGFVLYGLAPPMASIEDVYIIPEERKSTKGLELLNRVIKIAREAGCVELWTQVPMGMRDKEKAMRVNLALGFKMMKSEERRIIFCKDIRG